MHQLSEILDEKGHDVLRIEADASVFQAVERMVEANVGSLLVTDGGNVFHRLERFARTVAESRSIQDIAASAVIRIDLHVSPG